MKMFGEIVEPKIGPLRLVGVKSFEYVKRWSQWWMLSPRKVALCYVGHKVTREKDWAFILRLIVKLKK